MVKARKAISSLLAFAMVLSSLLFITDLQAPAAAAALTGKTAMEITTDMDAGWNLGNTLDANATADLSAETSWGNPKTSKAMIDAVAKQGFKSVRIPVSWGTHTSGSDYKIDSAWMARVKEIVNYAIDNGLYVILNIHHDNDVYFYPNTANKERSLNYVSSIWKQVAAEFKDYDQHLIFEILNEPRLIETNDEWWFNVNYPNAAVLDSIDIINQLNQAGLDAIRAAGGNNTERCVMVPGYCASIDGCTTATFKMPDDTIANRLIISVHAYTPYNFALNASGTNVFSDNLKSEVDSLFNTLKTKFLDKNIPVVIGEASASNKDNASERMKWVEYYYGKSSALDIPVMLWDNNVYSGSGNIGEQHGFLNRLTCQWYDKALVDAMVKAYGATPEAGDNPDNPDEDDDVIKNTTTLFTGSASADAWAQAMQIMTVKNDGGTLDPSIIKENGYFYVEYTGDAGQLELIMQSWSGGTKWAQIAFSESGMAGENYYAKFSYADCLSAFSTDLVSTLDCVYIGARNGSITVKSLAYVVESAAPVVPDVLAKPVVAAKPGDKQVTLFWNSVDGADYYQVIRYNKGVYSVIATIKSNSLTIKGLTNSFEYTYLVKAVNSKTSSLSTAVWVTPKAPITLTAEAADKSAKLSWNAVAGASYYQIIRYKNGTYSKVANVSTTSATVKGLTNNFEYTYLVAAFFADGSSVLSSSVKVTPQATLTKPVLNATAGNKQATLSWTAADGAKYYQIIRYKNGEYSVVASVSTTSAVVMGLTNNYEYTYLIKAIGDNASSFSNAVNVTPKA